MSTSHNSTAKAEALLSTGGGDPEDSQPAAFSAMKKAWSLCGVSFSVPRLYCYLWPIAGQCAPSLIGLELLSRCIHYAHTES